MAPKGVPAARAMGDGVAAVYLPLDVLRRDRDQLWADVAPEA